MKRKQLSKVVVDALATAGLVLALAPAISCSRDGSVPDLAEQTSAIVSTAALQLKVLTASCGANQMQDFFQITNTGTTAVKLSDIKVKLWADDTSGQALVPHIATGGCASGANGSPSCVHQVTGVTATPASFTPACGPDATHQANWEITISTTDGATLPAGAIWGNLQSSVNLANFSNFNPGTSKWFSSCLTGSSFVADSHFAVYYQGTLVFSNGINAPDCRGPHGSQPVPGYVRPPTSTVVGPVPAGQIISLSVNLPVRNLTALQAVIAQASNPSSPSYRHYASAADMKSTYNPTDADYAAVVAWARGRGFNIVTSPSNLGLDASGTAAQIEQAFHANLVLALRPDGTQFYELDRPPSIDLTVPLSGISGLDNYVVPKPHISSSPLPGLYSARDLETAYLSGSTSFCSTLDGSGQSIGLFQMTGFNQDDIDFYAQKNNLTGVLPVQVIVANNIVNGTLPPNPLPVTGNLETAEISMDIEMALAMAPRAQIVAFEGTLQESILREMADHREVSQFSSSWDIAGSDTITGYLSYLAGQGQTFFIASGDHGAYAPPGSTCPPADVAKFGVGPGKISPPVAPPVDVRTSPFVTVVGGTALETASDSAQYSRETIWPGSGGGVLTSAPIPDFQVGITLIDSEVSTVNRNVPDVAMLAQSVYIVTSECNGMFPAAATGSPDQNGNIVGSCAGPVVSKQQAGGGGTSVAAPLWAGFMALVNQKGHSVGLDPLGPINETIYKIGKDPVRYPNAFHDIGVGSAANTCEFSYSGRQGYDLTTGLGSPRCGLVLEANGLDPSINVGISGTTQGGPMVCVRGNHFTPGGTVTISYPSLPETALLPPRVVGSLPVANDGTINLTDNQISFVGDALAAGTVNCTADQIANGTVTINVTDDATGITTNESVPASFWCQSNASASFNVGCFVGAVTIRYQQFGACTFVPNVIDGGGTTAPPNGAYVVFQLEAINNQLGSTAFPFDQTKLFVLDPHTGKKDFVDPSLSIYPFIFDNFAAQSQSVPPLTNLPFVFPADIALVVTSANGATEPNQTAYILGYDQHPTDPPVITVKLNPTETTFPNGNTDCSRLGLTESP
jgi:hypothetical protein